MIFSDYLKLGNAAVLSLMIVALTPEKGMAQYNPPKQTPSTKRQNVEKTDVLKQKVSINGLPEYSGKQKFIGGMMHQTPIGPQYQEQFVAVEPPTQIVEWYKGALSGYKWDIVDSDANRVHAKKADGSYVVVTANPYKSPDGRSLVRINYHDYHIKNTLSE